VKLRTIHLSLLSEQEPMRKNVGVSRQTTFYVIAYDIPDDKRRTKIHKLLSGFGTWTQFSLFECFLNGKEMALLRSKLAEHLIETEDSVRFYPLCAQCLTRVETVGGPQPHEEFVFIVEADPFPRCSSNGGFELRLSGRSTGGRKARTIEKALLYRPKNRPPKRASRKPLHKPASHATLEG
jgi:CRISPR-associated protein Cas2